MRIHIFLDYLKEYENKTDDEIKEILHQVKKVYTYSILSVFSDEKMKHGYF